jgi:sulfite exporter TauE/SafE
MNPDITVIGMLIAGLATSLHCAGMCGLLTCGLGIGGQASQTSSIGVYHFFRLIGYFLAGAIAGGIGQWLGIEMVFSGVIWFPLLLIIFLSVIACGAEQRLGAIPGLGKVVNLIRVRTLGVPPLTRAAIVGVSTPLLPCGPLYAVFAIALASGSWIHGGQLMLAFGFGAVPAIWLTQVATAWLDGRLSSRQFQSGKKILAALAALSLSWHFMVPLVSRAAEGEPILNGEATCRCALPVQEEKEGN